MQHRLAHRVGRSSQATPAAVDKPQSASHTEFLTLPRPTTISSRSRRLPRKEAGFQLGKVQAGLEPSGWKPFDEIGAGTRELRIGDAKGIFRVMYIAKFEEAVYVLHCFQKKTQTTSKQDKDIAAARYRAVVSARKGKK